MGHSKHWACRSHLFLAAAAGAVVALAGCSSEREPELQPGGATVGAHYELSEKTDADFATVVAGCRAVSEQNVSLGGFGAADTDFNVQHRPLEGESSVEVTVLSGEEVLESRAYSLDFFISGKEDSFDIELQRSTFRLKYWGTPTCD